MAAAINEAVAFAAVSILDDGNRAAGIAGDGLHNVEANAGEGRRRDARFDAFDQTEARREPADDSGRQDWKAADAGKGYAAPFAGERVEGFDADDEIGGVGEIEIVSA